MKRARKALVTGGTGSVGMSLVEALCSEGYDVDFQYHRNSDAAARLADNTGATALPLDLSNPFSLEKPQYDILINNAGVNPSDTRTHLTAPADWELTIAVNLTACFHLARYCLPHMSNNGWGRIVNISSIYGIVATEGYAPYVASKHGLHGLTKVIAKEYAASGVTCNQICPGPLDSLLVRHIFERQHPNAAKGDLDEHLGQIAEEIPAGRLGTSQDVTSLALFLLGDAAQYITGASIVADGGLIA